MLGLSRMDEQRPGRFQPLSPGRLAALAIAILILAAVVASASRPGDLGPAGPPTEAETGAAILRAAVILFVICETLVLALIVWALWPGQRGRRIRPRGGLVALSAAAFLQTAGALVLFWLYLHFRVQVKGTRGSGPLAGIFNFRLFPAIPDGRPGAGAGQEWLTVAIVAAVLAIVAAFLLRGIRMGRRPNSLARLAEQLEEAIEDGLEQLEAEADPRMAVIAAYARMERSLARIGMPRARHEAALEYLERMLALLDAEGPAARRLTELFQLAKFSDHVIDAEMKREAIHALSEIRDDLRARAAEAEPRSGAVAV
jgi:tetratricopeptide (TPR) repeat protein